MVRPAVAHSLALALACVCAAGVAQAARRSPSSPPPPPAPRVWSVIWQDDFSRAQPLSSTSKWRAQLGDGSAFGIPGWGNNELSYYSSSNVRIEAGETLPDGSINKHLVLQARYLPSAPAGQRYTSARIRTAGRFSVAPSSTNKRVRIEARVKLTPGLGLWPAFWMLPDDNPYSTCSGCGIYGGWAASGEIDIMEMKNYMVTMLTGSLHYGGQYPGNLLSSADTMVDAGTEAGWHVVALEWEQKQIRWYLDSRPLPYFTANSGNGTCAGGGWCSLAANAGPDSPFDRPFHLILNLAVGGDFTKINGVPLTEQQVQDTLTSGCGNLAEGCTARVDYVRVFGCPALPGEPCAMP